jgi:hypothetical protein
MDIKTDRQLSVVSDVKSILDDKVKKTDDVKTAIDLLATKTALEQGDTVVKLVNEKTEELRNDAEAKRVEAETKRVEEETKKILAEKEKQIQEYEKVITAKKKEVEQLNAESDKAEAFFKANSEILKYIGVRNKKSLGTMRVLMYPATLIFCIVQFLLFPLTFSGVILEAFVGIVGGVCGEIKSNALKIIISILVVLLIVGIVFLVYFYGGKLVANA